KIDAPVASEDLIKRGEESAELRLMFAERDGSSFAQVFEDPKLTPTKVIVLIGPEGGWTDDEIDRAGENGWQIVTLGGRTLRAETAAIVAATLLQHRFGD